jgi:hypothetical protein
MVREEWGVLASWEQGFSFARWKKLWRQVVAMVAHNSVNVSDAIKLYT